MHRLRLCALAAGALAASVGLAASVALGAGAEAGSELLLATTTSVQDSGLLDELLPDFTHQTGVKVRVVAVGSGAALRMGADGNADALLTHAPEGEEELVRTGAVSARRPLFENYFVLVGPREDPAKALEAANAAQALQRIHDAGAPYVSRGDDSGTHRREQELLRAAGLDPAGGWKGFASTGSGMGLTLQVAGERRAYVLSDVGSFLAFRERVGLVVLSKPEPALRNVYSLLRVNPERHPEKIHEAAARALEGYLTSPRARELVSAFGRDRFGQPLFHPLEPAPAAAP